MPEVVPSLPQSHCAMNETATTQEHAHACASPAWKFVAGQWRFSRSRGAWDGSRGKGRKMSVTWEERRGCVPSGTGADTSEGHVSFIIFLMTLLSGSLQFWLLKLMVGHLPLLPSTVFLDCPSCGPLVL